jgi:hypothetical protein
MSFTERVATGSCIKPKSQEHTAAGAVLLYRVAISEYPNTREVPVHLIVLYGVAVLLKQALMDIGADPERPGSKERPDILVRGARTYHLEFSRNR